MRPSERKAFSIFIGQVFKLALYAVVIVVVIVLLPPGTWKRVKRFLYEMKYKITHPRMPFEEYLGDAKMNEALKEYEEFKTPGKSK